MKCWIDIDTLQKYQNGTISTEEKPRLENHIDQCPICQENLMIIEMISEQEQSGAYVDNDHAAALIMSRLDKRLYSRDKISSRFKLLIHKLLPVRRKVISGATAAACMLMVVAGVVAFDRTFGDFLSGRDFSGLASGQQSSDDQDLLLEQQPDDEQPDLESGHQPVDDYSDPTFGNQSGGPSANGDQTTDRYPAIVPNNGYISTEKDIAAPHHLPINRTYGHTDCYTINISVTDTSGKPIDLTNASFYAASDKSVIWGRGHDFGGYHTLRQLEGRAWGSYFQLCLFSNSEDVVFFLCGNNGEDQAFYISDTIKADGFSIGDTAEINYDLNELHKVALEIGFMDRPGGKYEVSVFDPQLDHRETESRGSMFAFGAEGTKSLFMSPGSYMFAFKYADTGVCGYASRKIDVPVQREIRLSEDDVEFDKYIFKEPAPWRDYKYYIIQTGAIDMKFSTRLRGLLDDDGSVAIYIDKKTQYSPPRIIYSRNPDTEYESSIVTLIHDIEVRDITGESFVPSRLEAYIATDGKRAFSQYFSDISGNELRFIDFPSKKDMIMEIYDESGNDLLHRFAYSRYWDYLHPQLSPGKYVARVYPLVREYGIQGSAEYVLTIGEKYSFTRRDQ